MSIEFTEEFRRNFVKRLQGKDFILYGGLLELAKAKSIKRLEVEVVQIPSDANGHYAVCTALLEGADGSIYREVGDASPENVNKNIAPHLLRMAATRAKARALRDFTGIDMVAFEEVAIEEPMEPDERPKADAAPSKDKVQQAPPSPGKPVAPANADARKPGGNGQASPVCSRCGIRLPQGVYAFSVRRFKTPLCVACQARSAAAQNPHS